MLAHIFTSIWYGSVLVCVRMWVVSFTLCPMISPVSTISTRIYNLSVSGLVRTGSLCPNTFSFQVAAALCTLKSVRFLVFCLSLCDYEADLSRLMHISFAITTICNRTTFSSYSFKLSYCHKLRIIHSTFINDDKSEIIVFFMSKLIWISMNISVFSNSF